MSVLAEPMLAAGLSPPAVNVPKSDGFILKLVPWQSYIMIADALPNRPNLHITFDRGSLELMTLSPEHERLKSWSGRLVETIAEEPAVAITPYGSMTFRREDLDRGLEPDLCFWIANERLVRIMTEWDPALHPPPDLVLEIEVSRSALDRMTIWAAFRVPEVWRFDGQSVHVYLLQPNGVYKQSDVSLSFPQIPVAEIAPFLTASQEVDYLSRIRAFRTWVRQQIPKANG